MQITMRKERGAAWKHCSGQAKIFAKQKKAEETGVSWCIFNLAYLAEKRATAQHTRGGRGWFKSLSDSQFAGPGKIKQVNKYTKHLLLGNIFHIYIYSMNLHCYTAIIAKHFKENILLLLQTAARYKQNHSFKIKTATCGC